MSANAQSNSSPCLSERRDDNQITGTVVRVVEKLGNHTVSGYKIILLKPACYEGMSAEKGYFVRDQISEVQLVPFWYAQRAILRGNLFHSDELQDQWRELDTYLHDKEGQIVAVMGNMMTIATAYYIASPQFIVRDITMCRLDSRRHLICDIQ